MDTQGDRVRELRKSLNLTMEKFGAKLGIGKSSISSIENGTRRLTDQLCVSICNVFGVNESWLRSGEGSMFVETRQSFLDGLSRQYGLDEFDVKIIQAFLSLSPDDRAAFKRFIHSVADQERSADDLAQEEIDRKVASYRAELEAEAKDKKRSSPSRNGDIATEDDPKASGEES